MPATTYGDVSQRTAVHAAKGMLKHAEPILCLSKFGLSKPLPRNRAKTVKFRRPIPYVVSTTPAIEGVTPVSTQLKYEDVEATIKQYITVSELTDFVSDLSEDPVLQDMQMLVGENLAETIEMVTWGVLKAGTNVVYAGKTDASRGDVNDPITLGRQRVVCRTLNAQRAKKITRMIGSSVLYGTESVAAGFVAFGHTDLDSDVRDMDGFSPSEKYGTTKVLHDYESGKVEQVRYILTPLLNPFLAAGSATLNGMKSVAAAKVDVYPIIFIAKDSYGLIPLKGSKAITPYVLNPGTPSKSDPAAQRGYVSGKSYFECVRLNEGWMVRMEVGATDKP